MTIIDVTPSWWTSTRNQYKKLVAIQAVQDELPGAGMRVTDDLLLVFANGMSLDQVFTKREHIMAAVEYATCDLEDYNFVTTMKEAA